MALAYSSAMIIQLSTKEDFLQAYYGTDNPGIGKRIYLLRKDVVETQLKNRKDDLVARACYLNNIQFFDAFDKFIYDYHGAVRGVRLDSVAEGDEPKEVGVAPQETKSNYKCAAKLLVANPQETFKNLTPQEMQGLSGLVTDYIAHIATQAQQ